MRKQSKILIADDDALVMTATRRVLESAGYETLSAQDGQEALELTYAQRPDLLLLDVNMPKMDGFEVCRRIKSDPVLAGTFIIMLSGTYTDSDSHVDGLNLGADGYIARPIANRELLARVQAMLRIRTAENSLRVSAAQWSTTFDAVSDGIFLTDANYTILNCNRAAVEMWQRTPESLLGKKCYEVIHGAGAPISVCPLDVVCKTKQRKLVTFAQNERWFEAKVDPMLDANGNFIGTVHAITDITEQMQAEEALRESEDKFKYVFDHSVTGKSITLPSGEIHVNQAFCEMLGYSQIELQNSTWQEISHPDDLELTKNAINALLSGEKERVRFVKRYIHKGGSIVWADVGAALRRGKDGKPLYFMTTINDITARKQAEDALRENQAKLHAIMDYSPALISIKDLDGNVLLANRSFAVLDAPPLNELIGKNVFDIFPKKVAKQLWKNDLAALQAKAPIYIEEVVKHKDGTWHTYFTVKFPIYIQSDQPFGICAISNDITDRKQAELALNEYNTRLETAVEAGTRELRETQEKLVRQEKLAVLGQLAGSIGHELRNPLGIINNAIYFLRLVQPDADAKVKEYLGIIESETHIAAQIINDLLDFSRIKSVDVEPVSVSVLVMRTMERFVVPENVRVTVNLPENLPVIYVDPRQIVQVFGNLVINACQAMVTADSTSHVSYDGDLVISGQDVVIADQKFCAIAVKDTGVGISPENIKKLFEPLFTTKAKGIGLGLAVSKKLVEANGGWIEVESVVGQGSTFMVFLPVRQ